MRIAFFEMDISFYRCTESSDIERTTIKFFIPPIISDTDDLKIFQIMMLFLEKIEEFTDQNSDWTTFWINYLRLCWGPYRPMIKGLFIPTPRWISVNVQYYVENKQDIIIIRTSKFGSLHKFHVNLLMITNRDKFHYVNIQSLSRLHDHRGTSRCHLKRHFCQYCSHGFSRDYYLREHLQICWISYHVYSRLSWTYYELIVTLFHIVIVVL